MSGETYKGYGEAKLRLDELKRFVRYGQVGEWRVYFVGSALPFRPGAMWELAYDFYKAGYLELVQRRVSHAEPPSMVGSFQYIAYRTSKPWAEDRAERRKLVAA